MVDYVPRHSAELNGLYIWKECDDCTRRRLQGAANVDREPGFMQGICIDYGLKTAKAAWLMPMLLTSVRSVPSLSA
jgi:hypothetical protein